MNEKEIDMNELIESFGECSTDFSKTACKYYEDYLRNYQKEKIWQIEEYQKAVDKTMSEKMDLEHNWNELKKWLEAIRFMYEIEYKDIDTSEHYNSVLNKISELEEGGNNE